MAAHKRIVLITFALVSICFGLWSLFAGEFLSSAVVFNPASCPSFGKKDAPISLTLFEDFQCSHCQFFMDVIFPKIQERYIQTGMAHCTFVPIAIFPGSKVLANAALCVFHQDRNAFFVFLKQTALLSKDGETDVIRQAVSTLQGLDTKALEHCMATHFYYPGLDQNLKIAKAVMKKNLRTPTLYINGNPIPAFSFELIAQEIEKIQRAESAWRGL